MINLLFINKLFYLGVVILFAGDDYCDCDFRCMWLLGNELEYFCSQIHLAYWTYWINCTYHHTTTIRSTRLVRRLKKVYNCKLATAELVGKGLHNYLLRLIVMRFVTCRKPIQKYVDLFSHRTYLWNSGRTILYNTFFVYFLLLQKECIEYKGHDYKSDYSCSLRLCNGSIYSGVVVGATSHVVIETHLPGILRVQSHSIPINDSEW